MFLEGSTGFQVDGLFLSRGLFGFLLPALEVERAGFGLQYKRGSNSTTTAMGSSLFVALEFDRMLRPVFGEVPLYFTLLLGAGHVHLKKTVSESGVGFLFSPELHYRLPVLWDRIHPDIFAGYTGTVGGPGLYHVTLGLGLGISL